MTPARMRAGSETVRAFGGLMTPQLVGRNCKLIPYQKIPVRTIRVESDIIGYTSPDSTYAVTNRLLDTAKRSILIGIYDFTAGYMKELLIQALRRGVRVSLMLDLDNRSGETPLFDELVENGAEGVPAPSCASDNARHFASSHEKVIVLDDDWTLVQSGNYSEGSIPFNEGDGDAGIGRFAPGNRDMGVAIRSKPLARFFTQLLRSDMSLELGATGGLATPSGMAMRSPLELLVAAPPKLPAKLFPSKSFNPASSISVLPVISPDNYMDVVPSFLSAAKKSIYVEQQYIRGDQTEIQRLLAAIRSAVDQRNVDVRIIVAKPFPGSSYAKEAKEITDLAGTLGLAMGSNIRILNPKHFVHCHNKLVIVDEETTLVGSQNWSDFAVSKNREASVLIPYAELARYFAEIFIGDWDTALREPPAAPPGGAVPLMTPAAQGRGRRLVRLNWGDYVRI